MAWPLDCFLPALQDGDDDYQAAKARAAFDGTGMEFVYPYGATLSVLKPSIPFLSSGKIAYPMHLPLGGWA